MHLAHDEVLGRSVAIKRMGLLPGTTEDDVARAQREARLAAGINHPHVVSILDLVKDDDCYWLVMELVEGRTLSELVAGEGPLDPRRAAALIAQAADGLVEANRAGIVHRDVKPSNIMVGDADRVKLGDFGIARSANDDALTRTGLVTGSPAYLAPEVASGQPATAASDVWSLGATLFHAVAGRAPYNMGQNVLGGLYKIVHDAPPRLPDDHPLAAVLAGMMTKDPDERWSVVQVRDELQRIARGEPGGPAPTDGRGGAETTMVLDAGDAALPAGRDPAPTPAPTPVAAAAPAAVPDRPGSRRRPVAWLVTALVLLLLAGLGAWLLWPGDGERPDTTAGTAGTESSTTPAPSDEPTEKPTASETSQEPTAEPSPSAGGTGAERAAMQAFVEDYFSRVTSDPRSTFEMLTPQFRTESGGYDGYSGFWSTISSARPYGITADPKALTVSYTIDYVKTNGDTTTQQVQLQLQKRGDTYLIAGEG